MFSLITTAAGEVVETRAQGLPGQGVRERQRAMDEHDRTINRMRNDARATRERRRSLFPQINEDFQRIQVIHNEIVRMFQPDKNLNYDRLAELTEDMKKRSVRLRENLALPEPEKSEEKPAHAEAIDDSHLKKNIVALHDLVVSFVANPLFKNLGVVDAKVIDDATENLNNIIECSDEIKREAKSLGKSAKK
ncbi:MAG TPA: hypothetical protein VFT02_00265 [Pyrinomonadaceae bacterium]|nr:hypothetical protein [Pyrinomonadaceae bacterium]